MYCAKCIIHGSEMLSDIKGKQSFESVKAKNKNGEILEVVNGNYETLTGENSEKIENENKESIKAQNKKKRKKIIEKNLQTKRRLQETVNSIRCEMNCPNHKERVMTTRKCIDVASQTNLPLFYCIDCGAFFVSCCELGLGKIALFNGKDLFNCEGEIVINNPDHGTLENVGKLEDIYEEKLMTQTSHLNKCLCTLKIQ